MLSHESHAPALTVTLVDLTPAGDALILAALFAWRSSLRTSYRKTHFTRDESGDVLFAPLGLTSLLYRRAYRLPGESTADELIRVYWRWGYIGAAIGLLISVLAVLIFKDDPRSRFGIVDPLRAAGFGLTRLVFIAVVVSFPSIGVLRASRKFPVAASRTFRDVLASQERLLGSAWVAWAFSVLMLASAVTAFWIASAIPDLAILFAGLGATMLILVPLGPVVLKFRSLRKENERLEIVVAMRTEELRQLNASLEQRVSAQVEQLEKLGQLKRFLSPKVSELIIAGQLDDPLATRRREVTIMFVDLRGFTAFSETAAPEDVLGVLREYHAEIGRLVNQYDGTIEHFAGDGVMLIFNDPAPLPDPALSAVRMAVQLRDSVAGLAASWRKLGYELGCGLGIAQGYATIGTIGFPGRQDYGVVGAVNNLAARLCAQAASGQVLVSQRVFGRVEDKVVAEPLTLDLKGIRGPVSAFSIVAIKPSAGDAESSNPRSSALSENL